VVVVVIVGAIGLTVCEAVVILPLLLQLYVLAPLAPVTTFDDNTELKPVHIVDGLAIVVTVGKALMVNGTGVVGP